MTSKDISLTMAHGVLDADVKDDVLFPTGQVFLTNQIHRVSEMGIDLTILTSSQRKRLGEKKSGLRTQTRKSPDNVIGRSFLVMLRRE